MKNSFFSNPQLIFTAMFLLMGSSAFSQKPIVWKGGTPGMEQQWECPKNWSTSAVPDEFSNVYIPDVSSTFLASPIIQLGRVEVNALFIESNAQLKIEKDATLTVYGNSAGFIEENIELKGALFLMMEYDEQAFHIALARN